MSNQRPIAAYYFFALSIMGLSTAWYFNFLAVLGREDYLADGFTSNVDWVYSLDLLIGGIGGMTFMVLESRRLGMKNVWVYIALGFVTAFAFVFPLFLAMRELRLQKSRLADGRIDTHYFGERRVDVWIPKKVDGTTPVLVMHDGKNVFFSKNATDGQTWGVLAAISEGRIRSTKLPLIVAVYGLSGKTRVSELGPEDSYVKHPEMFDNFYPPFPPETRVPRGNEYQRQIAQDILPELAAKYGIELDPSRTALAGSSMGGLASLYGMSKHPEVYGTALCFSTHWPFGFETLTKELCAAVPAPGAHRIWTDTGTIELDALYLDLHNDAVRRLEKRGYEFHKDLMHAVYPNTGHNEKWWAGRVEHPINWWLNPNEPRMTIEELTGRPKP